VRGARWLATVEREHGAWARACAASERGPSGRERKGEAGAHVRWASWAKRGGVNAGRAFLVFSYSNELGFPFLFLCFLSNFKSKLTSRKYKEMHTKHMHQPKVKWEGQ
jgi:hypothetical protein